MIENVVYLVNNVAKWTIWIKLLIFIHVVTIESAISYLQWKFKIVNNHEFSFVVWVVFSIQSRILLSWLSCFTPYRIVHFENFNLFSVEVICDRSIVIDKLGSTRKLHFKIRVIARIVDARNFATYVISEYAS